MGYIIGAQIGTTSGCAVYKDGRILFAASEERYSRRKNDGAFPDMVIEDIKNKFDLNASNIEKIVIPSEKMTPIHFLTGVAHGFTVEDYLKEEEEYYKPVLLEGKKIDYLDVFKEKIDERYLDLYEKVKDASNEERAQIWNKWRREKLAQAFGVGEDKVVIMNHEYSHAAYAYYGSKFRDEDTLAVTFDGYGDDANAAVFVPEGGKLKALARYTNFNIGRIYRYITLLLGMKPNEHEYKVMGLAPYATEYHYKKPLQVFESAYKFNMSNGKVEKNPDVKDSYYYFRERFLPYRFDGIAGALQIFTEKMNTALCEFWLKKTARSRIVLGGVPLST